VLKGKTSVVLLDGLPDLFVEGVQLPLLDESVMVEVGLRDELFHELFIEGPVLGLEHVDHESFGLLAIQPPILIDVVLFVYCENALPHLSVLQKLVVLIIGVGCGGRGRFVSLLGRAAAAHLNLPNISNITNTPSVKQIIHPSFPSPQPALPLTLPPTYPPPSAPSLIRSFSTTIYSVLTMLHSIYILITNTMNCSKASSSLKPYPTRSLREFLAHHSSSVALSE